MRNHVIRVAGKAKASLTQEHTSRLKNNWSEEQPIVWEDAEKIVDFLTKTPIVTTNLAIKLYLERHIHVSEVDELVSILHAAQEV